MGKGRYNFTSPTVCLIMAKSGEGVECPKNGCDYTSSKQGVKIHYGRSHDGSISGITVECAECGDKTHKPEYKLERSERLYCSPECWGEWQSKNRQGEAAGGWEGGIGTTEYECANCGEKNTAQSKRVEQNKLNFCDTECMAEHYASGYIPSGEEHKWYGVDRSGENNWLYGVTGSDHPAWRGGHDGAWRRDDENKWRRTAREVYKRDGYVCQLCGENGKLHAHHIIPDSKGGPRYKKSNLVTLCMSCHNHVHSKEYEGELLQSGD